MLRTEKRPNLMDRNEMGDPIGIVTRLCQLKTLHPAIPYKRFGNPRMLSEVSRMDQMEVARDRFKKELHATYVATFDVEGKQGVSCDGLVLHPLGGTCVYINLHALRQFDSKTDLTRVDICV